MSPEVLNAVGESYGLSNLEFISKVTEGYLSNNFVIENDGKKYFLKQYRYTDLEKIKEIHRVKFFFSEGGIPVILPLKNRAGDFISPIDGKFYSLFPFIEGRIIRRKGRSDKAFASAGEMLARIHLLSINGIPDITSSYFNFWSKEEFFAELKLVEEAMKIERAEDPFDTPARESMAYKADLAEKNTIFFEDLNLHRDHIIHGDYHGNNLFYDESDAVQWVFDIEKATIAPRSFELARCIDFMCFAGNFEEENFADARVFLSSYSATYPIEKKEVEAGFTAFYLKLVYNLWVEKEHYLDKNNRVDLFLESDLVKLKYYSKHLGEFISGLNVQNG